MNGWFIYILILSTIAGWLISRISISMLFYPIKPRKISGITFQGLLPRHKYQIMAQLVEYILKDVFSQKEIQEKFVDRDHIDKLLPQIEIHIDDFLRHRLGKKMPMVGMFIGENTIRQLKEVFMEELKEIFPVVMTNYIKGIGDQKDLGDAIAQKLNNIRLEELKQVFGSSFNGGLRYTGIIGALVGLVVGVIQVLIIVFASHP